MGSIFNSTITLGTIAQIPIKLHWSFSLLLLFVGYIAYDQAIPSNQLGWFFAYVFLLFVFVIMHEYGHALTARKFGIRTRDIILSPIGGIARLERLPERPLQELIVALAGPGVNVILALFFLVIQLLFSNQIIPLDDQINFSNPSDFIGYLLLINIVLVLFNLLPAFPMDGGRVLRSLIAMVTKDRLKATKYAVLVGQLMALAFIYYGFTSQSYVLMFIGIFVFFTAKVEYRQLKLMHLLDRTYVEEIMRKDFTMIESSKSLREILPIADEKNFLVQNHEGAIIGSLPEQFIEKAKRENAMDKPIGTFMSQSFGVFGPGMSLSQAFHLLNAKGWAIAQVVDRNGNKKGVIDRQLLLDFIRNSK